MFGQVKGFVTGGTSSVHSPLMRHVLKLGIRQIFTNDVSNVVAVKISFMPASIFNHDLPQLLQTLV